MQNTTQARELIKSTTNKINAVIDKKNATSQSMHPPKQRLLEEEVEFLLDKYMEQLFELIEDSRDVAIPSFGKFLVNGAQQAGILKFRELLSQGILDRDRLINEPKKAKEEMYKRLNAANVHTFKKKSEQGKGRKKIYNLSREKLKEFEMKKGVHKAKLPNAWILKLQQTSKLKKNIK